VLRLTLYTTIPNFLQIHLTCSYHSTRLGINSVANILHTLISLEGYGGIFISLFCVIIASQMTRGVAKLQGEKMEESVEEEIERK